MLGFTASAARVFIGAKYRALDSCKIQIHTQNAHTHTYTGLLMGFRCLQSIRHMRRFLVCLWVAVGVGGVWVGDVFVFPAKLKARLLFFARRVCFGRMYTADVSDTFVHKCILVLVCV